MSEKRFFTKINKNGRLIIIDKECHTEIIDLTFACEVLNILDGKLKIYNEQLGEQQDTISALKEENEQLEKGKMEALSLLGEEIDKNEQLMGQIQILKKEVRDFLHLCDVCDIQSHLSDECEEVLNDDNH